MTFHVFDPRHIEDILDADLPALWREEDARAAAENRKRAAAKAAMKRAAKKNPESADDAAAAALEGWDDFDTDGLLR